jgi:hypothetical protein
MFGTFAQNCVIRIVSYINCKRRAARVAYGELSEKTALTTLFFIWR